MGLSRRTLRVLLVLGVVVGLIVGLGAAMTLQESSGQYSGQGYVGASDNGPNIALPADGSYVDLESTPANDNEIYIRTDVGNATFTSNGYTEATADDLEGDWSRFSNLNVTQAELTIDPDDKAAASVSGDADTFEFRSNIGVDNGQTDFIYSGTSGTTTVTVQGVPADTTIGAVDQNNNLLAVATSDSSGQITLEEMTNSEHEVRLMTSDGSPQISNANPTGDLDSPPSEISFDVDDPDFDTGGSVDVTVTLDGDQIHSETLTAAQSVSTAIPSSGQTAGEHNWQVDAVDEYGNEVTETYSYRVPDTLYIRDETDTTLINDTTEVTVQFFGDDEVFERTTTDGTVDLTGLPVDQDFSIQAEAGNYSSRTVYIQTIYDQQTVYLLPDDVDSVETRFELNDPTGQFPSQTVLYITKPITEDDGTVKYQTVHADEFGVEGVTPTLEAGQRYRLRIENPSGTTQDMGTYRTDVAESIEIRPDSPAVEFSQGDETWSLGASIEEEKLFVRYEDPESLTDSVTVTIHQRGNESNLLHPSETYYDVSDLSTQFQLDENETEMQWVVNFEIDRDGQILEKKEIVSQRGNIVPSGLGGAWQHVIGVGLLLLSAGAFSLLNRGVGAVMIAIQGGLLWWTGWLAGATAAAAIVIYLFIAIGFAVKDSNV